MAINFTGSNLFTVLLLFAAGLIFIIKGGDWFVDAATWIAEAFGIPKFIVGATVVSFATTLPEMLVSVFAALEGNADIAVGNAVGSVTANTGLIMCLSLVCMPCLMTRRQFGFKASLLLATIAVLFAFTRNGQLSVAQSFVILLFFAAFLAENLMAGKREHGTENAENRPQMTGKALACNLLGFVLGAATIVLGAQLLIDNGSALAKMIGVPDSIIAATMIAIGTSLPELVTTLTAIRKKESSLSVGNIIGANIMDLTLIMPLCSLIQGRAMLVERQGMLLDIPACLIVTAAALVPALISGRFKRWTGFLIGGLYIAYLAVMFTCFGVKTGSFTSARVCKASKSCTRGRFYAIFHTQKRPPAAALQARQREALSSIGGEYFSHSPSIEVAMRK